MPEPVITVDNLGKTYWLYPSVWRRLLGCFVNPQRVGARPFRALSGLSFALNPGEAIALIGKNGAGKSTALQVLAGITPATEGSFHIQGRVCALLELGSGFNPEFTGRQNIALAGALLGLTREQVKQEEENIINFAEIGEFIDQPVKFYSSGMFVRLAFAVAVAGQPDLLIVDEALAVGDIFFRQKCYARLREMRENGMAVILVTHSTGDAQEFCDKGILLEQGRQTYIGDPTETMVRYYFSVQGRELPGGAEKNLSEQQGHGTLPSSNPEEHTGHPWPELVEYFIDVPLEKQQCVPGAALLRFCLTNEKNQPLTVFEQGSVTRVYTEFLVEFPVDIPATGVTLFNDSGIAVYSKSSIHHGLISVSVPQAPARIFSCHEITLELACGEYSLSCGLAAINRDTAAQMAYCGSDDWVRGSQRLTNGVDIAVISIVLPFSRFPSRVVNFGLVNLPSRVSLMIRAPRNEG